MLIDLLSDIYYSTLLIFIIRYLLFNFINLYSAHTLYSYINIMYSYLYIFMHKLKYIPVIIVHLLFFNHKLIISLLQEETALCFRFTRFVTKYSLMSEDNLIVPMNEDGVARDVAPAAAPPSTTITTTTSTPSDDGVTNSSTTATIPTANLEVSNTASVSTA